MRDGSGNLSSSAQDRRHPQDRRGWRRRWETHPGEAPLQSGSRWDGPAAIIQYLLLNILRDQRPWHFKSGNPPLPFQDSTAAAGVGTRRGAWLAPGKNRLARPSRHVAGEVQTPQLCLKDHSSARQAPFADAAASAQRPGPVNMTPAAACCERSPPHCWTLGPTSATAVPGDMSPHGATRNCPRNLGAVSRPIALW